MWSRLRVCPDLRRERAPPEPRCYLGAPEGADRPQGFLGAPAPFRLFSSFEEPVRRRLLPAALLIFSTSSSSAFSASCFTLLFSSFFFRSSSFAPAEAFRRTS